MPLSLTLLCVAFPGRIESAQPVASETQGIVSAVTEYATQRCQPQPSVPLNVVQVVVQDAWAVSDWTLGSISNESILHESGGSWGVLRNYHNGLTVESLKEYGLAPAVADSLVQQLQQGVGLLKTGDTPWPRLWYQGLYIETYTPVGDERGPIMLATAHAIWSFNPDSGATPRVSSPSIAGNYALTAWTWGSGQGESLLRKSSGKWNVVSSFAVAANVGDLEALGVPKDAAKRLIDGLQPVLPEADFPC